MRAREFREEFASGRANSIETTLRALIVVSLHIIATYSRERRNYRIVRAEKGSERKILVDANNDKPRVTAVLEFTCLASRSSSRATNVSRHVSGSF